MTASTAGEIKSIRKVLLVALRAAIAILLGFGSHWAALSLGDCYLTGDEVYYLNLVYRMGHTDCSTFVKSNLHSG